MVKPEIETSSRLSTLSTASLLGVAHHQLLAQPPSNTQEEFLGYSLLTSQFYSPLYYERIKQMD